MARQSRLQQQTTDKAQTPAQSSLVRKLPNTTHTGVNAKNTKSILVSAMLEVHGQVRFGDGTDVGLTITETDMVLRPSDGKQLQKFIFAGSKRRGVDRRTIHGLRDLSWDGGKCYIPDLCCECPVCWLYGFTGTTQKKDINAKSRVLYASSVSIEEAQMGLNVHSRNQVDEKSQTTAGSAGIHEEQIIVAGVHFPTYTALVHVLDWEIGAFAHALLENVNSNRYTAASRAQGGIKFAEIDASPLLIVDESESGIFPLAAPKIPGWENEWQKASKVFQDAMSKDTLKAALEAQGFVVSEPSGKSGDQPQIEGDTALVAGEIDSTDGKESDQLEKKGGTARVAPNQLSLEAEDGVITVSHDTQTLMTRYTGPKALGYLRQKQLIAKQQFATVNAAAFHPEISSYIAAISPKSKKGDATDEAKGGDDDGSNEE